jgi:SAM-dependent methyltransferase
MSTKPTIQNQAYKVFRLIERRGLKGAVSESVAKVARLQNSKVTAPATTETASDFKTRFGEDGRSNGDLRIESPDVRWSLPYQPSSEAILSRALQHVTIRHSDYVFVDIGAGKGLVLLRAAEYPFKSVIGVEFSESLALDAQENIRTYPNERQCNDVQCVCADATKFALPSEPVILYLFNPFQGELMDRMIENIKASLRQNPRDLWIVYINPWEDRKFRRSRELTLVKLDTNFSLYRTVSSASYLTATASKR